ncbi:MAG: FtsX-like permease family protein [Hyphomicrobiaceae bacterium]
MTSEAIEVSRAKRAWRLPRSLVLAFRDLRGETRGFAVFVVCIALGVAAIAGIGALTDAIGAGFAREGRVMLGGDLEITRIHKRASDGERQAFARIGTLSEVATMRAMARKGRPGSATSKSALVEIKAVDKRYPLVGALELSGEAAATAVLRQKGSVAVAPLLMERLQIANGDVVQLGTLPVTVAALVENEPDKFSGRASFGPRILMSLETLAATGLVQPGSLIRWRYRMAIGDGQLLGDKGLAETNSALTKRFLEAGFQIRDRRDPAPGVRRAIDRVSHFLILVGLTAMLVGGVGVANAVASYIDRKRKVIATFKSLGATNRTIFTIYLIEVLVLALLGIVIGLALGYVLPHAVAWVYRSVLPIELVISFELRTALLAAAYGLLVALVFVLWPLGRAERVSPAVLFRDEVDESERAPRWPYVLTTIGIAAGLAAFTILSSGQRMTALYFCLGIVALFALFFLLGVAVSWVARRLPRPRQPEFALALANLSGPGSLTRSVVLSLGTGLSLLVTVALTDHSIVDELQTRMPANSPSYYFLDIPKGELETFKRTVKVATPNAIVSDAPMLRGRIVKLAGRSVTEIKASPETSWVLNGDRGLTYSEEVPKGSTVVAGTWWPKAYDGPPLVSFEADLAKGLGLKVGDTVTVNVLGRNVTAKVSNLRKVDWESLSINFVMIFSPNTLRAAPFNLLATVAYSERPTVAQEGRLVQNVASAFPGITSLRVQDAIDAFTGIFARVMTAVRVAGSVTLLAGAVVLAGALATAQRRRIYQAVVLKVLGATRWRIIRANAAEYLSLAVVTALFATLLGTVAAWLVTTQVIDVTFVFSWWAVLQAVALAAGLVLVFGGFGTWRVLKARPVPYLRSE